MFKFCHYFKNEKTFKNLFKITKKCIYFLIKDIIIILLVSVVYLLKFGSILNHKKKYSTGGYTRKT